MPKNSHREDYDRFIRYPGPLIPLAAHNQEPPNFFLRDKGGINKKSQDSEKRYSPFAQALCEALQHSDPDEKSRRYKKADLTKDGVITATELYITLALSFRSTEFDLTSIK